MKKVNMKRFIYFFIFFLLVTLGLFYVLDVLGTRTIQAGLINSSKNQMGFTDQVLNNAIDEATMYGIQYTADESVQYYQNQKKVLDVYDSQMQKKDILNRLNDQLLSSQVVDIIGIYWKKDNEVISNSVGTFSTIPFQKISKRGWQVIDGNLYYFSVYPYIIQPKNPKDIQYIVGVRIKPDYLKSIIKKTSEGPQSNTILLINKSKLISNKPVKNEMIKTIEEKLKKDSKIAEFNVHTHEGDYFFLESYIKPINAYLVTYTRTNTFLNPLREIHFVSFLSIPAILVIGLIVLFMFYRNFYQNVNLLNQKFYQVEQGDYSTWINENPTNEFNSLFKSFNNMVSQINTLFNSLKIETELRRNAELKHLQAQINPHFLYNSLFFIMSMATFSPEAVIKMSKHLAEYYRYLTNKNQKDITLASELKLADHYLSIMSLCKEISYDICLPSENRNKRIMPLIIQPIVENAIQHGIEGRQGAHQILIEVKNYLTGALISVSDDGKGLKANEIKLLEQQLKQKTPPEGENGIGLWNVNHRLINTYGEACSLQFSINNWGGLTVSFYIDFSLEGGQHAIINS